MMVTLMRSDPKTERQSLPMYCTVCGAGVREYSECEEPDCKIEFVPPPVSAVAQTFTPTPDSALAQTAETFEGMVLDLRDKARTEAVRCHSLEECDGAHFKARQAQDALIAHDASQRQLIADLVEAVQASEREYDEETTPGDPLCAECNLGTGPHRRTCAHHLRVAVIAKAGVSI